MAADGEAGPPRRLVMPGPSRPSAREYAAKAHECAEMINAYHRARGRDVNARVGPAGVIISEMSKRSEITGGENFGEKEGEKSPPRKRRLRPDKPKPRFRRKSGAGYQQVKDFFRANLHRPHSAAAVAEKFGLAHSHVWRILAQLEDEGLISRRRLRKEGYGGGSRPFVYKWNSNV